MFPKPDAQAIDLTPFQHLEGVVDVVYNPLRTQLVRQAQGMSLPAEGGLYMLVGQAVAAVEIFLDQKLPDDALDRVFKNIYQGKENIVLTGMPGCGKSTVGRRLSKLLDRPLLELDQLIEQKAGMHPAEIIRTQGEAAFRDLESEIVAEAAQQTGCVISTGGGVILREENMRRLRANGRIYFIDRPLKYILPTDDRPLSSDREALEKRFRERYPIYKATADVIVPVKGLPKTVAEAIRKDFQS